jgi:peptide/nickel transport system substrate-binding protein
MWNIHIDEGPFFIGTVANYPRITVKSKKLMNYPKKEQLKMGGFVNPWIIPYPAVTNTETWSYA